MPTDPRTPYDTWRSRGPTAPAPTLDAPPALAPSVVYRDDPDTGDWWTVHLGAFRGADRQTRHAAEADAAALAAALAPLLGLAARVDALLASPDARDAVAGRCAAPASAALAVLRWVRGPVPEGAPEGALGWGDAPTLDRLITGAGVAVVCGEEGE